MGYKEKKARLRELVKKEEAERIQRIQQEGHQFKQTDAFRIKEKQYKAYQHVETDFSTLVSPQQLHRIKLEGYEDFEIYSIEEPQGAYLVKRFMNQETQLQIGFEALNDFARKPYRTNLDGTNGLYLQQKGEKEKVKEEKEVQEQAKKEQEKKQDKPQTVLSKAEQPNPKEEELSEKGYYFDDRIRMANLGFQYDWPHRCYPKTQVPIPASVTALTQKAELLFKRITKVDHNYRGEAVIVNYYKPKEYMIGHLDDGQQDQQHPIFSFNFGLSCVFLMGFPEKEKEPLALRLQAGDLFIMSGFSRICYHGVPRIIENSYLPPKMSKDTEELAAKIDEQRQNHLRRNGFKEVVSYFSGHRLNVNVRQVWIKEMQQQLQKKK